MTSQLPTSRTQEAPEGAHQGALALICQALERLKFGAIQLTIHEGRLVQIEVTEKTRLPA